MHSLMLLFCLDPCKIKKGIGNYLIAIGGSLKRIKHSAYLVFGILEVYRGRGIGFQRLEEWAIHSTISGLELTVATQNEAGLALYNIIIGDLRSKENICSPSVPISYHIFVSYFCFFKY